MMRDERRRTTDEGRRTTDEKALNHSSIVLAREASDRPSSFVLVLLALSLLLSSCGYRFASVGGIVPEDARTIAIPAFINGTGEPYVDVEVTKAVVNEFLTDGRLKVVSEETADLVLKGKVTKFEMTPSAYTADNYVQSYTVSVGVNVTVEDVKTHKRIWQETGIGSVFNAGYGVSLGDITATKIAKEAALKSASRDVASTLRSRLLDGF
jgi:outer membrane lipopolysaccharide assembly protein LptE/RlpB